MQLATYSNGTKQNSNISFHNILLSLMNEADIYFTGSNSRMLSKDIITEFRGRAQQIMIYPLSFEEFIQYNSNNLSLKELLKQYYTYGYLPQVTLF